MLYTPETAKQEADRFVKQLRSMSAQERQSWYEGQKEYLDEGCWQYFSRACDAKDFDGFFTIPTTHESFLRYYATHNHTVANEAHAEAWLESRAQCFDAFAAHPDPVALQMQSRLATFHLNHPDLVKAAETYYLDNGIENTLAAQLQRAYDPNAPIPEGLTPVERHYTQSYQKLIACALENGYFHSTFEDAYNTPWVQTIRKAEEIVANKKHEK